MMSGTRLSPMLGFLLLVPVLLPGAATGQPGAKVLVAVAPAPEAPLSLSASDGAGLELVSLSARAVIEDPLAFTELHLVFRNPEARVREVLAAQLQALHRIRPEKSPNRQLARRLAAARSGRHRPS